MLGKKLRLVVARRWQWVVWNADLVLYYSVVVPIVVGAMSMAMLVLWWLPIEVGFGHCIRDAAGNDRILAVCYHQQVVLYDRMFYYAVSVAAGLISCLIAHSCRRLFLGKPGTDSYTKRLPAWAVFSCVVSATAVVLMVSAWCKYLIP